jgi:arylsulfatase A-like enzyme
MAGAHYVEHMNVIVNFFTYNRRSFEALRASTVLSSVSAILEIERTMRTYEPNRINSFQLMIVFGCLLALASGCAREAPPEAESEETRPVQSQPARPAPPNVLLIAVDDLNDWEGYTGTNPDTVTPNIDALAARGTAFTQAYSQFPLCGPSRASLFSGLLPSTLGLLHQPRPDQVVADAAAQHGTLLLHSYFSEQGYKTMAVGKLLHRHVPKGSVDLSGGRGDWDRLPDGQRLHWESDNTMTDWGVYPGPEEEMSDPTAAAWAIERLRESHDRPFLLMVGFLRPHVPWYVPQKYFDAIGAAEALASPPYRADDLEDVPEYAIRMNILAGYPRTEWAIETGVWNDIVQAYLASTYFADHYVGQVLDALERSPYADNTIVVLFSDHGYHLGEKNTFQKQTLWERANKVPLIFAGPGIPRGEIRGQTVGLLDIYPTLLGLTGLPANPANEGHSLVPVLNDAELAWSHATVSQWRRKGDDSIDLRGQTIQSGPWRYSLYGDGSEELYNHEADPNEWTNLAADPGTAAQHRELMDGLRQQLPAAYFTMSEFEAVPSPDRP